MFFAVHLDATHEDPNRHTHTWTLLHLSLLTLAMFPMKDQRVKGITKCMAITRELGLRDAVIAGDMNSEFKPGTAISALIPGSREPTEEELREECAGSLRLDSQEQVEETQGEETAAAAAPVGGQPTEKQMEEWMALREGARASLKEII